MFRITLLLCLACATAAPVPRDDFENFTALEPDGYYASGELWMGPGLGYGKYYYDDDDEFVVIIRYAIDEDDSM